MSFIIIGVTVNSFQEIVGHLEHQYDDILAEESCIKHNPCFRDNRVHALLHFIPAHAYVTTAYAYLSSRNLGSGKWTTGEGSGGLGAGGCDVQLELIQMPDSPHIMRCKQVLCFTVVTSC
jgi:hypothetical protein